MNAHTPGPWEFHLGVDYACVMGRNQTTETALARLYGQSKHVEANGHLIAAAPDLLVALRAIVFQVRQGKVLERDACITRACSAIAKAEVMP